MLRSKKDVDRHVRDVFTKVRNEAERKLRGYNIARFYHNVGEHEIARGYLSQFLSVRPKAIDAHRLMGQIHEASGNAEKAVLAYKTAYELGDGQKDLVIKICELYCDVPCDVSVLMHWAEEGQRLCPHHETITKLRSTIISNSSDSNSRANLQELYLDQIKVNPTSADLQSSLVRLYLDWSSEDPRKLDEAYNYVCEVEARRPFTHSLLWYQTLLEVADRYEQQGGRAQGVEFHSWVVTALDRLVHLTLTAASASAVSFNSDSNRESYLTDAANILQRFDKKLTAVKKMNCKRELEEAMSGQLVFHLAQYVMISGKRTNLIRNPNMLSCLLLHACIGPPPDATSHPYFHKLACYRMSQSYHILHSVARDSNVSPSTLINKVRQQCSNRESKEEAFKAVFGSRVASDQSYFLHHSGYGEQELSIPSSEDAKVFDQVVSTSESSQLREIVWLYLQGILRSAGASSPSTARNASLNLSNLNTSHNSSAVGSGSNNANLNSLVNSALHKNQPYYPYKLFDGMQFATSHLNSAVADSLCHLDCLAFLAATIFCELENGVCSGSVRSAVCKTSVCSGWLLHTPQQEEWWTSAHDLFLSSSRRSALAKGVGKCRQIVQKGLEAVRILGTGGVSVPLAVHIARCFTHWASSATDDADVSISEVTALEERAEHCWQRVLSMCGSGKMSTPSSVHTPRNLLFSTTRYDLGALKLEEVEEEGRLFLAKRLIKTGLRQEALQALGQLKSPEASFQRAMVYKQQANEMASAVSGDFKLFTNEQRGQHTLYLTQARDTLYLTLDRLRMPGVDRNHPLNAALSAEMTNVERALTAITADAINASYLEADGESEPEPLSPIRHNVHDTSVGGESFLNGSNYNTTPARSHRVTSTLRLEARPSPERLDAQVRHLTSVQEQTLQNLCEQNAALRNQNSALRDTCNAVSSQVKENAQLFRTILENNKSMSLDCYYNILTEIKTVSSSVKDLQDEVQKLKLEVSEIKAVSNKRPDETDGRLEGLPAHPTPPSHQSMLSNLYMGCFAGQVGAGGVPHPLLPPQSSMLPGHAPHGSPFLPPATLAESAYMSGSNAAGLHVNRIMSGMSTMSSASDTCTASPSVTRVHFQELPSLTAPQAPAVVDSAPTGLLPAPYGASTAVSVASGTLSGILSTPYGTPTSSSALPGLLAPTYASTSSSSTATATAPHNYQIPLPVSSLSGTAPFPRQSSDRPSSMIPTAGLLASVPPPIYSAVTPDNSALPVGLHGATTSTSLPTTAPGVSLQTMVLGGTGLTPVSTPLPATPLALTGKVKTIPQRDLRQDVSEPASGAAGASGDLSTLSNTSNEYYHDDGHDPCPDFVPVVPLPAKVEVCTGEEDEQVLFEDRARLYRMSSKEWKERGTGVIKVLHNSPKKTVRVLMRRDQTYKICANHFVTPALQLMKLQKQDDVWLWAAQDFADEELTSETFCCRFKTVEVASRFNRAITEAKMLASDYLKESSSASAETPVKSTPSTAKPLSELFKKPLGSWTCSTCCVVNTASAASCIACSSSNPKAPTLVEGCATTSNGALDLSGNSGGFKFGLQTTTSVAPPVFSSVLPAKGSGSITFGISGQTSVSKASPFSTPTPTLFSTPVSKTGFSIGFSKDDTPSTLFVTPNSTKSELNNTVTTVVPVSSFNTPSQTSLFSTPFASVTTAQLTPSSPFSAATTNTTAATSLFGTPVTSTKFSVAPPASGIFAPASSVPEASSATATATTAQSKTVFGGFSFTSTPSIATPKEEKEVKKEEAPKKPSIFSSFTFAANAAESGISSSPFTFKKEDASGSTVSTGGLFSNFKASDTLTFGALAGDSSALGASDVFKTKDADAFKPKPLFAGNTSRNNVSANANESSEKVEEFEPEIHFEPVIPLPELVQVKTGEEDEEEMFCERAKLFRWADATKEWKERGLGDIKILSNTATGKIRVLMRREKTLKICANHYITPDLSLSLWNDSDKALMWVANDFADGEMVRELFVVKFKSPEFASAFKGKFEKAQQLFRDRSAEPSTEETNTLTKHTEPKDTKTLSLMDKFRPAAGSWECDTCLLRNKPDSVACASCQTLKPGASASDVAPTANTTSFSFGINSSAPAVSSTATGFSASAFTFGSTSGSTPSFSFGLPASKAATSVASSTTALTSIANASFTFKPSTLASKDTNLTDVAKGQSGFKFGSPEKFEFSFKPRPPRSRDTSHCESEDGVVEEDEGDHLYFEPVVPLPDKVDVVTGEEEEVEVYCHRAKLFRKAGPEWKERGLGDVKILRHRDTGRVRLLMRREQVHKICLNHYLTENIKFNDKDEKSFYWVAQDYSEDTPSLETFAIRFKTPEVAQKFKKAAADALSQASAGVPTTEEAASSKDQTNGTDAATTEASGVVRARKLLLPDEFFAFENSEERCSGCIGCKVDTLQPFLQPDNCHSSRMSVKVPRSCFPQSCTAQHHKGTSCSSCTT
ncbi:Zinc finger RanBP2-type [Trinorchestia longiramus]|nr:Zinc finger RanBP2-type [Trinorchestia longiramus]